ncbi:MAG TPA: hypothetical protein GXZ55_10560 [Natronincola sp.]|nr:hypothetical protein [Natronincola sp.]
MKQMKRLRVMTIVHGKSEYNLCSSVRSNLRLPHEIIARKRGANSIQITSLLNQFNKPDFVSFEGFVKKYPYVGVDKKKRKLLNFRIFPIMDVDDCSLGQKEAYKKKEMFWGHWLYDYITPIYSDPNLEETMRQAGIGVTKKKDYIRIFPTNHGDLNLEMARTFLDKLRNCRCTNLDKYVSYCLDIVDGKVP